ncbi:MAG TPA: response regulator [Anaerolineales bacterium]|nr:response regulator [Anaerolineales bacterium]
MAGETGENIRLLIVDDIAETRENLRKLLQFESDIEVVGAARTGEEALQMARDTQPDVVLMDINLPDTDGITVTEALLREVRHAQIIMLSVQSDQDYLRQSMRAGARDFIAKPPASDELVSSVRRWGLRAHEERKDQAQRVPVSSGPGGDSRERGRIGRVLAVYSPKGGVGCTTLASNLALGLNTDETPTVLVDANLQFGDVAVFLNLQVKNSFLDLASRSDDIDEDLAEEVLIRHDSGLRILAAPPRPEHADEVSPDQVRKVLQYLKRNFVYVVVDTHKGIDDITLAVLDSSDVLFMIATPDIPAIKDARLVFDLLGALEFPRERIFFVLNKVDRKSGITAEAVSENLKRPVDGEIPADEKIVTASINRGVPLLLSDRSKPPGRNILELLATVRERLMASQAEEAEAQESDRPRLFSR